MFHLNKMKILLIRSFHTSKIINNEKKAMRKILHGTSKKKHRYTEAPILPSPNTFSKGSNEGKRSINSKRATVLNKLFMRYITDLMSTGECSSAFLGHQIEINRIQVAPDFQSINVYWLAKGTENDEIIENILNTNSGLLRHELSQLKIIGVVPKINFLKDKHMSEIMEVDLRLAKADFGEDYVPVQPAAMLLSQLQLNTKISPQLKQQIEKLNSTEDEYEPYETIPMINNIMGLDHSQIMDRITKNISKSNLKRAVESSDLSTTHDTNDKPIPFANNQNEREALKQFLFKRQLLKSKMNKNEKNYNSELSYLRDESQSLNEQSLEDEFDNDYIDDDINKTN